jgi:hypothetical protein
MPIWDDEQDLPASQAQSISQRVRAGAALPILSNAALFDLALFGYESFRGFYAQQIKYPFPQLPGPAQLANYDRYSNRASDVECKAFYLDCLKNHIYREARAAGVDADTLAEARAQADGVGATAFAHLLGYPRFDQPQAHPLLVLANLPFKTYLTISPTTFVEDALRWAGKEPVSKMCRWRGPIDAPEKELWLIADDYWPSASRPLVYHLCGLDAHPQTGAALPDSLALTEDDHLELLVNLAEGRGKQGADRLPALVRGALFDDVALLGFSLNSWAFRALYYGLIRQTGQEKDRRGVCLVQLPPDERAGLERYLQSYLDREARFDIFWGDLHQYAQELNTP